MARNSGQQGRKARRDVAKEVHRVGQDLHGRTGRDIRDRIPPEDEIVRLLETQAKRKSSIDSSTGKKFTNEYLRLKLAEDVHLLVSTGSGKKLDEELSQPFLEELNTQLTTIRPGQLVFHRLDRIFRTDLLVATTLHLCKQLDITMIDGVEGPLQGDLSSLMAMIRARDSSEEAARIPKKTRDGQRDLTGTDMAVQGFVTYGVSQVAPAGMMVVRRRAPNGGRGLAELHFDTPSDTYPDPDTVLYGLPEVFTEVRTLRKKPGKDGQPRFKQEKVRVDQVALVRFALAHLGKPGWGVTAVGRALTERGFSTHRLRVDTTPSTTFTTTQVDGQYHRVMRPIINRLDFYRTGKLPVRFGVDGVDDVTITNCFPPDGPWATHEDFDRITTYLASTTGGGPASQGLTGVLLHTCAGPLPLRAAPRSRSRTPAYVTRAAEDGQRSPLALPPLPHALLAESIVTALTAHAGELLTPLVPTDQPEVEALRRRLHAAEATVRELEASKDVLLAQLTATDNHGQPLLTGAALQAVSQRYNDLDTTTIAPARKAAAALEADLAHAIADARSSHTPLHYSLLLRMVDSLRDPHDTTYNELWKSAITIDGISRTRIRVHDTAGTVTRWHGTIRTTGGGHTFTAPFHGEYRDGAAANLDTKVDHAIAQLLTGTPFQDIQQTNAHGVRSALAERLGFDSRYFALPVCRNPRLVRIAAHLATDPDRDIHACSTSLGEPVDLVTRVLAQLTSGRPNWDEPLRAELGEAA